MDYPEQKKELVNGMPSSCLCHTQEVKEAGNVFPPHYHSYIEILYGLEGTYDVWLNGKLHRFTEGELVLINSKEVHQINALSENGGRYLVLRFEPEIIYSNMFGNYLQLKYALPFILENASHQKVISRDEIEQASIPALLLEIEEEFKHESYGYELAIQNLIGRVFLWIIRYFHNTGMEDAFYPSVEEYMKHLQPALEYVIEHYAEELKISHMAALCSMSVSYFSRVFNQQMRMNFNEYVNRVRLMEAEKLLVSTTLNITEISSAVGYDTTSYFIKLFKDHKEITPGQFRAGSQSPDTVPVHGNLPHKSVHH